MGLNSLKRKKPSSSAAKSSKDQKLFSRTPSSVSSESSSYPNVSADFSQSLDQLIDRPHVDYNPAHDDIGTFLLFISNLTTQSFRSQIVKMPRKIKWHSMQYPVRLWIQSHLRRFGYMAVQTKAFHQSVFFKGYTHMYFRHISHLILNIVVFPYKRLVR